MPSENNFDGLLEWRCIGPYRGGRVVAVAGDAQHANVFYFGSCGGGVWKSTDAGTYWENVSDGFFKTSAVGALEVSPSDPNVIYAGMGETTIRIDVSHGDGVYKSTDAGKTWQHVGLADTRFIGKIRVHPANPDLVYVAALGHAFGPNSERGVYRSEDGGKNWQQVLFKSDKAGAVDLSIDASNPRLIYASIWETYRTFWEISSGGPDSGLWRSTDGGDTWTDLSENPGMPKGVKGKIGVVASPAQTGRVWAIIEHQPDGGVYRSDDGGDTWEKVCADQRLLSRAWYYLHIHADPLDPNTLYINNLSMWKSIDGGKTWSEITTPHGDNHDLWIDPHNSQRMIQGNDGGANVSFNGGASWTTIYNQPTAQFYHIATDNRTPYYVYGTQQDNSSIAVPSRSSHTCITWADGFVAGTGESGFITVHPDDNDIVYVGAIGSSPGGGNSLQRYDHRTRQIRLLTTWPEEMTGYGAGEHKYRFAWTYPIVISPHDPNTLYIGGNIVFRSTNEGQSWEPISPDLTLADPETLKPSGGPINRDAVGAETYATVFAFAESAHERGVLWAGSDDGLVHISRDGGANWTNITPSELPEKTMISHIELSPHDQATAYLAAARHKLDDYHPYLFKTTDYGASWQRIDSGIADNAFTRVIRADPTRKGLLYAGTETGLWVSFDDGANWQSFQLNLPVTPIYDLLIKDNDLIAGTHGRSFWILDDITPLYQLNDDIREADAHVFAPRTSLRIGPLIDWGGNEPGKNYVHTYGGAFTARKTPENGVVRSYLDAGKNPPKGAIITYHLKAKPADIIRLEFADSAGNLIRAFTSAAPEPSKDDPTAKELKISANEGWNRFVWDLRYAPAPKVEGSDPIAETTIAGPLVVPGIYTATLTVGEQKHTASFEVICDPAAPASQDDLQAQVDLLMQIHQKVGQTAIALNQMRDLRAQLDGWAKRVVGHAQGATIAEAATTLRDKVLEIEKIIHIPDLRPGWADTNNSGVRLFDKLNGLTSAIDLGNYRPTDQAHEVFAYLTAKIDAQLEQFKHLLDNDLAAFNRQVADAQISAVVPKTAAEAASPVPATSPDEGGQPAAGTEGAETSPPIAYAMTL